MVVTSEGSGKLKEKLLIECWNIGFKKCIVVRVVGSLRKNIWINVEILVLKSV